MISDLKTSASLSILVGALLFFAAFPSSAPAREPDIQGSWNCTAGALIPDEMWSFSRGAFVAYSDGVIVDQGAYRYTPSGILMMRYATPYGWGPWNASAFAWRGSSKWVLGDFVCKRHR